MARQQDRFSFQNRDTQVYSDFLTDLSPHPVSGDIVRFVNEQSVIRSIKNLISTDRGERLYQPSIGSSIRKMLFEPMGSSSAQMIATFVGETIREHEPRAKLLSVDVIPVYEKNTYVVNVSLYVINKQEPITFNVALTRVR